jgi:predicted amidohydrolase
MRVTVCQWPEDRPDIPAAWDALVAHTRANSSELVVLPEMPFAPWIAHLDSFDPQVWAAAVASHDAWEERFAELGETALVATRPIDFGNERYNEGFIREADGDSRGAHIKARLEDADGARETTWYQPPATAEFTPQHIGGADAGFLIGRELWLQDQACTYGAEEVQLLITPRASVGAMPGLWLAAGRAAATLAGAFEISSSRAADERAGAGWIIDPGGAIVALTSAGSPFVTVGLDLERSTRVRRTD